MPFFLFGLLLAFLKHLSCKWAFFKFHLWMRRPFCSRRANRKVWKNISKLCMSVSMTSKPETKTGKFSLANNCTQDLSACCRQTTVQVLSAWSSMQFFLSCRSLLRLNFVRRFFYSDVSSLVTRMLIHFCVHVAHDYGNMYHRDTLVSTLKSMLSLLAVHFIIIWIISHAAFREKKKIISFGFVVFLSHFFSLLTFWADEKLATLFSVKWYRSNMWNEKWAMEKKNPVRKNNEVQTI